MVLKLSLSTHCYLNFFRSPPSLYKLMLSISQSMRVVVVPHCPQYRDSRFRGLLYSRRKIRSSLYLSSSSDDDVAPNSNKSQGGYDPSEDLFGLGVGMQSRNLIGGAPNTRSWFGPNGQYIRELPCPSCRGRGYTPCTECGVERSRSDCSQCNGKGILTCQQCLGDCVIWEESIDERPWEKARSISPLKVKEDDDVDKLDIKLDVKQKTKRIYQSSSPEVNLKISRSLKSLNAKTGLFSNRMKIIHQDPVLRAQRVAAIKKTKRTDAARKHASESMKAFFGDPENRRKRSLSMKGVKYYCKNCGREGHRSHYCPELRESLVNQRFRCGLCGEKGHNKRTCPKSITNESEKNVPRYNSCGVCGKPGHNRRTCPQNKVKTLLAVKAKKDVSAPRRGAYTCSLCFEKGHNSRTCPSRNSEPIVR